MSSFSATSTFPVSPRTYTQHTMHSCFRSFSLGGHMEESRQPRNGSASTDPAGHVTAKLPTDGATQPTPTTAVNSYRGKTTPLGQEEDNTTVDHLQLTVIEGFQV